MDSEIVPGSGWVPGDLRIELLQGQPPAGFDCGREAQNSFLYRRAWRDAKAALSATHILYARGVFAGYVTLVMDRLALARDEKPKGVTWQMVGAAKLAQLAVDKEFAGKRLGTILVRYAVDYVRNVRPGIGCRFLTLDAEQDLIAWYEYQGFVRNVEEQGFRVELARRSGRSVETLPVSMRFDLREIHR